MQRSSHAKGARDFAINLEQVEHCLAPTGFENDPHLKRIALDVIEWYDRLAKLAELRDGGG
jgi:hypothetical protein